MLNYIIKNPHAETQNILSSFQSTMMKIVIDKIQYYAQLYNIQTVAIGGGVAANNYLRKSLIDANFCLKLPEKFICGDNALMIGLYAYLLANK